MATKKIRMQQKSREGYDLLHPETTTSMVLIEGSSDKLSDRMAAWDSKTRLAKYHYLLIADSNNQTVFEIPLETFNYLTDYLLVVKNSSFLADDSYTISGRTLTLNNSVVSGTELSISIIKNVITDDGSAISGSLFQDGTIPLSKLSKQVAELGADGKVPASQLSIDTSVIEQEIVDLQTAVEAHKNDGTIHITLEQKNQWSDLESEFHAFKSALTEGFTNNQFSDGLTSLDAFIVASGYYNQSSSRLEV